MGALCYGAFLKGRLGGFDLPIAIALEGIGFFILTHVITVPAYAVGTILYGFGFGLLNPALILQLVKVLPREGATLGLSLLAGSQNLFQFFSAPVLAFLAPVLGVAGIKGATGIESSALANWNVAWMLAVVYFIFVLVLILIGKAKAPQLIAGIKTPAPAAAEKMEAHEDDDQS